MHLPKWMLAVHALDQVTGTGLLNKCLTKALAGLDCYLPTCQPYIMEPLLVLHTPSQVSLISVT